MPVTLRCQRVDILGVLALVGLIMLCCDSFVSNEEFNSTCKMSVPPGFKLIILQIPSPILAKKLHVKNTCNYILEQISAHFFPFKSR